MKYDKEKLEQHIKELTDMTIYVGDNIVWESQCGQSDHFDSLNKSEQIALVDIFAKMKGLKEALIMYQHWFENTKIIMTQEDKEILSNNPKITIGTKIRSKANPDEILIIISDDCHGDKFECSNGDVLSLKQIEKYYDIII